MSEIRINILNTINAKTTRIDKTKENGEDVYIIRNHLWMKDGVVLNSGLYGEEENEKGYMSMEGRLFTAGHPTVDGKFVTISNQDNILSNKALESHYVGASVFNVRKEGGDYYHDVRVVVNIAKSSEIGRKLIDWCDSAYNYHNEGSKAPDCINTSTGLMCNRQKLSGNSRGKNYTWLATNQRYDHQAYLYKQAGAGGDELALSVNQEEIECFTVNMSDAEQVKDSMMFLPMDESDDVKVNWMQ